MTASAAVSLPGARSLPLLQVPASKPQAAAALLEPDLPTEPRSQACFLDTEEVYRGARVEEVIEVLVHQNPSVEPTSIRSRRFPASLEQLLKVAQ